MEKQKSDINRGCMKTGIFYIVSTPIGNLGDMTERAVSVLGEVDVIAAEDTRHSRPLLQHFSIDKPLLALHDHNEKDRCATLLAKLQAGKSIALICDAGTPLISDPGYHAVKFFREHDVQVVPIPGACAAIAALSAAGLPTNRFCFEGFLPAKSAGRVSQLNDLIAETRTMIFYESPHRIIDSLQDMQKVFGEARQIVLARELTKKFETIRAGTIAELIVFVEQDSNQQRGEMVLLVQGAESSNDDHDAERVLQILLEELPVKQAAALAAKITGARKNELYQQAIRRQD
jgi:16S rRNA (cytidine1402-2'-O)-methyltransferase